MPVAHVNEIDLYYEIYGEGFPLVLAHGYSTSINLWKHQIPLLSQRYRVVAYDVRGHGLSSAPAGKAHYTLAHLVSDMHALLQHLGIEQAYIAGHSMGGATTAGFAATHPDMTKAARSLNMPVAIIMGTDDVMHRGAEILHRHLPQSHFASLQDAPHDSMNARPEAFNQVFLDYLDHLEQGKPVAGRRSI
jgi:pimeloyl-ACP methyl ester carboxylesterase